MAAKLAIVCKGTRDRDDISRYGIGFGKPSFPNIPKNNELSLVNFVGNDSWISFHSFKNDTSFLEKSINMWEED